MEAFARLTSSYLAVQGTITLLTPRVVLMAITDPRPTTDFEVYICRILGMTLLAFAALVLLFTDILPNMNPASDDAPSPAPNSYASATVIVTTIYHAFTAFYLYSQLLYGRNIAFIVGCVCSTVLFSVGIWTILFGQGGGRFSKTTGADKHTSNFPFSNKESARAQKKDYKEKRKSLPRATKTGKEL